MHTIHTWMAGLGTALVAFAGLAAMGTFGADAAHLRVRVEPTEINDLLANPGMGWQTFHTFADQDKNLAGLPSSSAYFRFYWREVEPTEGHIDFAKFNALLAHAHQAGQRLAFRIMCTGSGEYMDVPAWLKEEGCKGVEFRYGDDQTVHWVPDFEDPLFQKAHFRLIRELGRRYDGSPDLDLVDIGSVGLWGEWHMSDTKQVDTGKAVPMPPLAVRLAIIDAWRAAFRKTPLVMQIGELEGLRAALAKGCGWRADCLGDMGGFSKTWSHMKNFYPQAVQQAHAENAWQQAPVAFESCWDMRKWKQEGWDIPYIFDFALRYHASYVNNKSAPIPEGTRPEIEQFLRKLGYRLVLRRFEHDRTAAAGSELPVRMNWENVGVAPPYGDYRIALRLADLDATGSADQKPLLCVEKTSIQDWLPGKHEVTSVINLPAGLKPGRYELSLALVDPRTQQPAIRLAIAGRGEDGWYLLSQLSVTRR